MPTTADLPEIFRTRPPDQVALLVPEIEAAMESWSVPNATDRPWKRYFYDRNFLSEMSHNGEPGSFSLRLALLGSKPQIELIQPVDGPSIYHDWINENGYGFHHFGYFVDNIDELTEQFIEAGYPVIQAGSGYGLNDDGAFAYFDLTEELNVIIELIEVPEVRRPPLVSFT